MADDLPPGVTREDGEGTAAQGGDDDESEKAPGDLWCRAEPLPNNADDIIRSAKERQAEWQSLHSWWSLLHYGLNIMALGLTLGGAALPAMIGTRHNEYLFPLLAGIATLLVAVLAFSTPSKQARSYIAAWRYLDSRLARFELCKTRQALEEVVKAVEEGERILAGKDPY